MRHYMLTNRAFLFSVLLSSVSLACISSVSAMHEPEGTVAQKSVKRVHKSSSPLILVQEEIKNATPFGQCLNRHCMEINQQGKDYLDILTHTILPTISPAGFIQVDDTTPEIIDSTGQKHAFVFKEVECPQDKNKKIYIKIESIAQSNDELLKDFLIALEKERERLGDQNAWVSNEQLLNLAFFDPKKTTAIPLILTEDGTVVTDSDGQPIMVTMRNTSFKKPRYAAVAIDNNQIADPQEVINLIKGAKIFKDASSILLTEKRVGKAKVVHTSLFAAPTVIRLNELYPNAEIYAEVFSDRVNPGGGFTCGAHAQEECNVHACPELGAAIVALTDAKFSLEAEDAPKKIQYENKKIILQGDHEVDVFKALVKRDGDDRLLSKDKQFPVTWLFSASFDCRQGESTYNMPKLEEYDAKLLEKREGLLKVAALTSMQWEPTVQKILVLGAPGTGIFRNPKDKMAVALVESVQKYGGYFDIIAFAGMDPKFQSEILTAVKEKLEAIELPKSESVATPVL